jgi:hypothetical protein
MLHRAGDQALAVTIAAGRYVEREAAMVLLFDESLERLLNEMRGGGWPVESSYDENALCVKAFEAAVDRLGHIAEELDDLAQSSTSALLLLRLKATGLIGCRPITEQCLMS